jgi:hypothetical protein
MSSGTGVLTDGLKIASIREGGAIEPFCGELSVNSGTHRCVDERAGTGPYFSVGEDGAPFESYEHGVFYYPNEDWCVVDPGSELHNILTSPVPDGRNPRSIHSTVFTFHLDNNICNSLLDFVAKNKRPIGGGLSLQDIVSHDTPGFDTAAKPLLSCIRRYIQVGKIWSAAFLNGRANRRSTTVHPKTGQTIGLHLDNSNALPLDQKDQANIRLGVNLGPGVRYFWMINLSLRQLADAVSAWREIPAQYFSEQPSTVGQWFMDANPGYRVVRIKMDPGTCYLAPTQQFLHDGSTAGSPCEDNVFFLRGMLALIGAPLEATALAGLGASLGLQPSG